MHPALSSNLHVEWWPHILGKQMQMIRKIQAIGRLWINLILPIHDRDLNLFQTFLCAHYRGPWAILSCNGSIGFAPSLSTNKLNP